MREGNRQTLPPAGRAVWRAWLAGGIGLVASVLLTFLGLLAVTFVIGRVVPIDPVLAIVGDRALPEVYERVRLELGLDRPLWEQLLIYLGHVLPILLAVAAFGTVRGRRLTAALLSALTFLGLVLTFSKGALLLAAPAALLFMGFVAGGRWRWQVDAQYAQQPLAMLQRKHHTLPRTPGG